MSEKSYRIRLNVPLGIRIGTMSLHEADGNVTGRLNVMNEKNGFCGALSKEGQLTVTGVIRTLISTVHYTATGTICGRNIFLNLKTDSGACFPLFGEEYFIDDEVL